MQEFSLKDITTQTPTKELQKTFHKTRGELKQIVDLCRKRNFFPVIVNMPVSREESQRFSSKFIEDFYWKNIEQIVSEGVIVFDYFDDKRFSDIHLYENYADCLNDDGRSLFSSILTQDLKKAGIWRR